MGFVEIGAAEDFGIGVGKKARAEIFTDGEIHRVAQNGGHQKQRHHQVNIHFA